MSGLARFAVFLFPVSWWIGYQILPAISQERVEVANRKINQTSSVSTINRPTLKNGSQGDAVSELQAILKLLGYYSGDVDGIYNERTAKAVTRFQEASGLNPDGIVDQNTWEKLFPVTPPTSAGNRRTRRTAISRPNSRMSNQSSTNQSATNESITNRTETASNSLGLIGDLPTLKLGMRGSDVFWLQKRLQTIGFFQGNVDGIFGQDTHEAVKAAQENYGLKADGIVGAATWQAILAK